MRLIVVALVPLAALSCAAQEPAATDPTGIATRATLPAPQGRLAVKVRWPDGVPLHETPFVLYGLNAAGGAQEIATAWTDEDGRAVFEYGSGSGPGEVRARDGAKDWKAPVTLPYAETLDVALPPPHEVALIVAAAELWFYDRLEFFGDGSGDSGERSLRQPKPGRFVWRSLIREPVKIGFRQPWDLDTVVPEFTPDANDPFQVTVTPPAELHFRGVKKRSLTLRVVTTAGDPFPALPVTWGFTPSEDWLRQGTPLTNAEGRIVVAYPECWTLGRPPPNTSVSLRIDDGRVKGRPSLERAWDGKADLDLGDLVVELMPDRVLSVLDAFGVPIPNAHIQDAHERLIGRTDASGRVVIRGTQGIPRKVSATAYEPVDLDPEFFAGEQLRTVELRRVVEESEATPANAVEPPPVLTGRVVDESGRPVPFARVTAWDTSGSASACNSEADGSFRLPRPPEPWPVLQILAEGHAVTGRSIEALRPGETIPIATLRQVRVRVVDAEGKLLPRFEWLAHRPDLGSIEPPPMCGRGEEPDWSAAEGSVLVPALRDERAAVLVKAERIETFQPIPPGATEIAVVLRPQVSVDWQPSEEPPPWALGIFMRITSSPGARGDGFRSFARPCHVPRAHFLYMRLDPGLHTIELVETTTDGQARIRSSRVVGVAAPDETGERVTLKWDW